MLKEEDKGGREMVTHSERVIKRHQRIAFILTGYGWYSDNFVCNRHKN